MSQYKDRVSFTVPVTAGQYAPEKLTFDGAAGVIPPEIDAVSVLVESAPAGAVIELWLPRVLPSTRPVPSAEYFYASQSVTGAGGATWPLTRWRGAQIRVRSGGAAGTAVVDASGD